MLRGNALYVSALELARKGGITCRNIRLPLSIQLLLSVANKFNLFYLINVRVEMLNCESEYDFLAKVHCVRLAFDEVIRSSENRDYFKITARELVSSFFSSTQQVLQLKRAVYMYIHVLVHYCISSVFQDPSKFCHAFDDLTDYLESEKGWKIAVEELTGRKVTPYPYPMCAHVYIQTYIHVHTHAHIQLVHAHA